MKQNRITICIDLLFCLVILPIVIMLAPVEKWIVHHTAFMLTLIVYLYALYFAYRKINIPSLVLNKKYLTILTVIVILVCITGLISMFPMPYDDSVTSPVRYEARRHLRSQTVWYFFFIVTGFSLSIELTFELFRQILSKHEIEAEKNKAELALYKSQINPHFLFNTLNTLYALVVTQSEHTEKAFITFSDMLKYMYRQTESDTIDIDKEITYIRQYIDLQKLRLNPHTQISFSCETDDNHVPIPPMILITFIENAFKYGTSSEEDSHIQIRLKVKNGLLEFATRNRIIRKDRTNAPAIGIANCRKRLELLYPQRFDLKTEEKEETYHVDLKIKLK